MHCSLCYNDTWQYMNCCSTRVLPNSYGTSAAILRAILTYKIVFQMVFSMLLFSLKWVFFLPVAAIQFQHFFSNLEPFSCLTYIFFLLMQNFEDSKLFNSLYRIQGSLFSLVLLEKVKSLHQNWNFFTCFNELTVQENAIKYKITIKNHSSWIIEIFY